MHLYLVGEKCSKCHVIDIYIHLDINIFRKRKALRQRRTLGGGTYKRTCLVRLIEYSKQNQEQMVLMPMQLCVRKVGSQSSTVQGENQHR